MTDETPPGGHDETQIIRNFKELAERLGQNPKALLDEIARDREALNKALLNPCRFVDERIEQKKLDPTGEYAQKKQELAERVARGEITPLEENLLRFTEGFKLVENEVVRREETIYTANERFKKLEKMFGENTAAAQQKITGLESRIKALAASAGLQQSAVEDLEQEKQALRSRHALVRLNTLASFHDVYARLDPAAAGQPHDDEGGAAPSLNTEYVNFLKRCSEKLGKDAQDAFVAWAGKDDRGTTPVEESLQNIVLADMDKVDELVQSEVLRLSTGLMQGYTRIQRLEGEKIAEHKAMVQQRAKECQKMLKNAQRDKVLHYLRWRAERTALQHGIAQLTNAGTQAGDAYKTLDLLYQGVLKEKAELATKYARLEADRKKLAEDYGTLDVLLGISAKQAEEDRKHYIVQREALEKKVFEKDGELMRTKAAYDQELRQTRRAYRRRLANSLRHEKLALDAAEKYIHGKEDELNAEVAETHHRQKALTEREQELAGLRTQMESSEASRKTLFSQLARALATQHKKYQAGIAEHKELQGVLLGKMKQNDLLAQHAYRLLEQAGILPSQQASYEGLL